MYLQLCVSLPALCVALLLVSRRSCAFQPGRTSASAPPTRLRQQADSSGSLDSVPPERLFASEGWPVVKDQLNSLPAFACANKDGQALLYDVDFEGQARSVPVYFIDVAAAQEDLELAQSKSVSATSEFDSFDILPYPLGEVFEDASLGHAVLLPSERALRAAGAPADAPASGQQVPLFACMDVLQESDDGSSPMLPLFMDPREARAAMDEAMQSDALGGSNGEGKVGSADRPELDMVCLSLTKAVALLATVPETPAFQFVPPESSIRHIREYLEDSSRDNKGTLGFQ